SASLPFALVALIGCHAGTTLDTHPPHGYDLYLAKLQPHSLVVPDAIKYLQRTALRVESDTLPLGPNPPSKLLEAVRSPCEHSTSIALLIAAIQSGSANRYELSPTLDPLALVSADPTPLQRLGATSGMGIPTVEPPDPTRSLACSNIQCALE